MRPSHFPSASPSLRAPAATRAAACLLACVLLAGAGGCYESLTSMATPDKLVFYDDLLGDYLTGDPGDRQRVSLARGEGKAYAFKHYDAAGALRNTGTLRIVKLGVGDDGRGGEHFYEFTIDAFKTSAGRPVFAVGRLVIEGEAGRKTVTGYQFKSKEQFFAEPGVTTAQYTYEEGGERKTGRALDMPAEKLQAYLASRAGGMTERGLRLEQSDAAAR